MKNIYFYSFSILLISVLSYENAISQYNIAVNDKIRNEILDYSIAANNYIPENNLGREISQISIETPLDTGLIKHKNYLMLSHMSQSTNYSLTNAKLYTIDAFSCKGLADTDIFSIEYITSEKIRLWLESSKISTEFTASGNEWRGWHSGSDYIAVNRFASMDISVEIPFTNLMLSEIHELGTPTPLGRWIFYSGLGFGIGSYKISETTKLSYNQYFGGNLTYSGTLASDDNSFTGVISQAFLRLGIGVTGEWLFAGIYFNGMTHTRISITVPSFKYPIGTDIFQTTSVSNEISFSGISSGIICGIKF
jgi:hypothetical protein